MSTAADNKALIHRFWRDVYEARDYERVGSYFTPTGRYEDVPIPDAPGIGPKGISKRLALGHAPVESFDHEIHRMLAEGDTVITEHTETWRFHTGEVIPLPFVSIHVIRDGKLELWRDYSDMNTLLAAAPKWWLEHISAATADDFTGT
jgi:limonene-1,2-epoxide hydrolase